VKALVVDDGIRQITFFWEVGL